MKTLTKKCIVCGNEFTKNPNTGLPRWKKQKFCSLQCINIGRTPVNQYLVPIICGNCGQSFQPRENRNKYCSHECARAKQVVSTESRQRAIATRKARYGYIQSPETREKIRLANLGSKSHFWKGGISKENYRFRRTARYKNWRKAVYERDDFTCQSCGQRGGKLHPHHIKSWENYLKLRFIVSNGQTLCIPCHKQTDTFARNLK